MAGEGLPSPQMPEGTESAGTSSKEYEALGPAYGPDASQAALETPSVADYLPDPKPTNHS